MPPPTESTRMSGTQFGFIHPQEAEETKDGLIISKVGSDCTF